MEFIGGAISLIIFAILFFKILTIAKNSKEQVRLLKKIAGEEINNDNLQPDKINKDLYDELRRKKAIGMISEEQFLAECLKIDEGKA